MNQTSFIFTNSVIKNNLVRDIKADLDHDKVSLYGVSLRQLILIIKLSYCIKQSNNFSNIYYKNVSSHRSYNERVTMKNTIILLSLFLLLISPVHAKNCKKGQPCGNSCISWSKTCRINTHNYQLATPSTSSTLSTPRNHEEKVTESKSSNLLIRYVIPLKLNVRTKPNTSSYIATRLIKGDFVLLYKVEGSWAYISKQGIYGWVKDEYLSLSPVT